MTCAPRHATLEACALDNVSVHLGANRVLRGLTAHAPAGQVTALLGPSGCGKTTLLRAVAGFERITGGQVTVGGTVVDGHTFVRASRRRIGFVPQDGGLFPHLDVAGNVAFGLARTARRARSERVGELLDLVGLTDMAHRRPHELSGGQQQRVALARALAVAPQLVLLDEPFSALDVSLRAQIRGDVLSLLAVTGTSTLLVTHDQDEALSCADHLLLMRHGRIVQGGAPAEVFRSPVDAAAAAFLGAGVIVRAIPTADGRGAICSLGVVAVEQHPGWHLGDESCQLFLRHDQLHFSSGPTPAPSTPEPNRARTAAPGILVHIDSVSFHGVWSTVRVSPLIAAGTNHMAVSGTIEIRTAAAVPAVGSQVTLHVDGTGRWLR